MSPGIRGIFTKASDEDTPQRGTILVLPPPFAEEQGPRKKSEMSGQAEFQSPQCFILHFSISPEVIGAVDNEYNNVLVQSLAGKLPCRHCQITPLQIMDSKLVGLC